MTARPPRTRASGAIRAGRRTGTGHPTGVAAFVSASAALLARPAGAEAVGHGVVAGLLELAMAATEGEAAAYVSYDGDAPRVVVAIGTAAGHLGRSVAPTAAGVPGATVDVAGTLVAHVHVRGEAVGEVRLGVAASGEARLVAQACALAVGPLVAPWAGESADPDLLIAVVEHELRNPVTVIKGYAEKLANHWAALDEDARRDAAGVIAARAGRLARLVDRVLAVVTTDGTAVVGPFDLGAAVTAALGEMPETIVEAVGYPTVPAHLPAALGDPSSLVFILHELVTNAMRYSPGKPEIAVVLGVDRDTVYLRVSDSGIGVSEDVAARAFDRYWRGPQLRARTSGFGLGLYLVRVLVERQGGWVSLRGRASGGTVAEVRFPRAAVRG